ncbi:hypothetical protein VTO73DRAFT_9025 [Trametes versicolor]
MQLSRRLNGHSFLLLSATSAAAALDLQTDGVPKGLSFLSAPAPAPTSATTPVSACVTQCVNDALKQGGCTSLADTLCFCANLAVTASLSQCIQRACPADEHSVFTLYTDTCATLPLPGLGSILPPDLASSSSGSLAASAPATASHTASDTQPAPSASQATPTPAATTSSAAPTSSANPGVVSSDPAGTQVTVTATSASASASALNPTVNGAVRTGGSVLGLSLALLVAAWSL